MSEPLKIVLDDSMLGSVDDVFNLWTCLDCQRTFDPGTSLAVVPEGFRYEDRKQPNGDFLRVKLGDLCSDCMHGRKEVV